MGVACHFDDIDLLKVLNMDPVTPDAVEKMPSWLRSLDGRRVRFAGSCIRRTSRMDPSIPAGAGQSNLLLLGETPSCTTSSK